MTMTGAATAEAAPTFRCEASSLRASVLGQAAIEPVTTGRTGDCRTAQGTPALAVPQLLNAQALIANTTFDATKGTGQAAGGVAQLAVVPAPDFVAQLPTRQFVDNLQNVTVPLPGIGPVQVNIKDAVAALVPTPGTALLSANVLSAVAGVSCQNGKPALAGSSQVAGVKLLGNEVGVNGVVEQSLAVMDSQSIDLSKLDLSKVSIITPLDPLVQPTAQALLGPALAALPPIQIPASVLQFKLTPAEQIREGDTLTQRALHAQISLLGRPVLDAVFGEAKVSAGAGTCATAAQGGVADQLLQCTDRKLVLVDVLRRGSRVKLLGAANRDYVGRRVAIRLRATGKIVAHATVRKDGSFQTYAPAPPAAMMSTNRRANRVRYRAEIGKELSLPLKLRRRMVVSSMTSRKGKVTIVGRVIRPLTTPVSTIRVVRRVSCHKVVLVARVKPREDGTFRITVKAPRDRAAAVYRLVTRVREKLSNPRTYPTYTLPRGVALNTR
jgi:hypothetical protein